MATGPTSNHYNISMTGFRRSVGEQTKLSLSNIGDIQEDGSIYPQFDGTRLNQYRTAELAAQYLFLPLGTKVYLARNKGYTVYTPDLWTSWWHGNIIDILSNSVRINNVSAMCNLLTVVPNEQLASESTTDRFTLIATDELWGTRICDAPLLSEQPPDTLTLTINKTHPVTWTKAENLELWELNTSFNNQTEHLGTGVLDPSNGSMWLVPNAPTFPRHYWSEEIEGVEEEQPTERPARRTPPENQAHATNYLLLLK